MKIDFSDSGEHSMRNIPTRTALAAIALSLLLGGCATGGGTRSGESEAAADAPQAATQKRLNEVEQRAQRRWDLLIAGKAGEAYDYLSPGARSQQTREQYAAAISQRPVKWLAAKVQESECEAESCVVIVEIKYRAQIPSSGVGAMEMPAVLQERWLKLEGAWVMAPKS
jgi:hypothetical protein